MHISFKEWIANIKAMSSKARIQTTAGRVLTPDEFLATVNPDELNYNFRGSLV